MTFTRGTPKTAFRLYLKPKERIYCWRYFRISHGAGSRSEQSLRGDTKEKYNTSNENIIDHSLSFVFEPTYKHTSNDTVYIKLQSCDKNMLEFYNQLDKQKLSQFNPFVEPVFIKSGQFNNAIGVFGSYVLSDSVVFVYPE